MSALTLKTKRLTIQPFSHKFLEDYYTEFTDEIVKYQYPDSFVNLDTANQVLSRFVEDMKDGKMLELVILTHSGEFVGSLEVFGLNERTPELGLWLKSSAQGKGYGYEALRELVHYLNMTKKYPYYIYEVDIKNSSSIHLVEKFRLKKGEYKEVTTPSHKTLYLQTYHLFDELNIKE